LSRQTKAAIAAILGLLVGLGTLAGVVLALRDETIGGEESVPVTQDTLTVETEPLAPTITDEPPPAVESILVDGFPNAIAVGFDAVWVVRDGRRVYRIDPGSRLVVGRIGAGDDLGSERPCDIATGEGAVWVSTLSGNVVQINPASNRLARLIDLEDAACVAAGAGAVWVTHPNEGKITRIDPLTGDVVAEIELDGFPLGIDVGFGSVWVATSSPPDGVNGGVSRIDPSTNEVVRTILVGNLPEYLAAGAGAVWVTSNNGTISQVDPRANQLIETIRITDGGRTSLTVGGEAVWATEITPPGEETTLYRIDPATSRPEQVEISTGETLLGLAFGAGALWIANYNEGTVDRYEP
jgi:streptogramin lyase